MKRCIQCGRSFGENKKFCKYCGVELEEVNENYILVGLILGTLVSIAGSWYFLDGLSSKVLVPALQNDWIKIHPTIGIISYSFGFSSLIVALIGMIRNGKFPFGATLLQLIAGVTFLFCIIVGAVWANQAWGVYWSWDPKETWSLIVFALFYGSFTLSYIKRVNDWVKVIGILTTVVAITFMAFFSNNLGGLHSYGNLF